MSLDKNYVRLTHAVSGATLLISPIHIVAIVPHEAIFKNPRVQPTTVGTHILTTPDVAYIVKESVEEVESAVAAVLGH